jgi:hypothetical protein
LGEGYFVIGLYTRTPHDPNFPLPLYGGGVGERALKNNNDSTSVLCDSGYRLQGSNMLFLLITWKEGGSLWK